MAAGGRPEAGRFDARVPSGVGRRQVLVPYLPRLGVVVEVSQRAGLVPSRRRGRGACSTPGAVWRPPSSPASLRARSGLRRANPCLVSRAPSQCSRQRRSPACSLLFSAKVGGSPPSPRSAGRKWASRLAVPASGGAAVRRAPGSLLSTRQARPSPCPSGISRLEAAWYSLRWSTGVPS